MQLAIDLLNDAIHAQQIRAETYYSAGNITEADQATAISRSCQAAVNALIAVPQAEKDNAISTEQVIAAAKARTTRCQALINVRDTADGQLDMDVTFIPDIDDDSPAHKLVCRFVEFANQAPAA